MDDKNIFKRSWKFLKKDTWLSLLVSLVIAFLFIRFLLFPLLSLITGASLPLVIVESCSMYHSNELEEILENPIYKEYGIDINDTEKWVFQDGLNKGDIVFVLGAEKEDLKIGDVIIFNANKQNPLIHRIISINNGVTTKGDHNSALLEAEKNIKQEQIIGRAVFRVPYLGWIKLIFFEFFRNPLERGFCT
jgi:signal peptidase I